jgi:hypothetical protein
MGQHCIWAAMPPMPSNDMLPQWHPMHCRPMLSQLHCCQNPRQVGQQQLAITLAAKHLSENNTNPALTVAAKHLA